MNIYRWHGYLFDYSFYQITRLERFLYIQINYQHFLQTVPTQFPGAVRHLQRSNWQVSGPTTMDCTIDRPVSGLATIRYKIFS